MGVLLLALLIALPAGAASSPPPTAWWGFEGEGERVEDRGGAGLHGSAPGCARAPGRQGQALKLDGASGMTVPDSPKLRGEKGFTLECWVRPDAGPGPARNLLTKPKEFMLRIDPLAAGGTLSFFVWCEPGGWEPRVRGVRLEPGKWAHVLASWDGSTCRLWVNRESFSGPRPGRCPRGEAPLAVGGPIEGAEGFVGLMDEVRVYAFPIGPLTGARLVYGMGDPVPGPARTDARFDFRRGAHGWEGTDGAELRPGPEGASVRFASPDSLLMVRGLAVDAGATPVCDVRLATKSAGRGVLLFFGERFFKEVPFRLVADGQTRTYAVRCAAPPPWEGRIEAMGLTVDGARDCEARLESIALVPVTAAPPDLRILALSPERRIGALKQPMPVTCWVRNAGGPTEGVRLGLSASPGIRVRGEAGVTLDRLAPDEQREVKWEVEADAPVEGEVRVEVACEGSAPSMMARPVRFAADPEAASVKLFRDRAWLRAGYPRGMDFRHVWGRSVTFLEHNTAFLIDFIGDKIPAAQDLKRRYPDRLVLMQVNDEVNGIWGSWHVVPREFAVKEGLRFDPAVFPMPEFRGYWLLAPGATLTTDLPADAETCEVAVPDTKWFVANVYGNEVPRDVLLYRRTAEGPDWSHAEYASVVSVDNGRKTVLIRRWPRKAVGEWRAFRAGEAWIAPSAGSIYGWKGRWMKTWIPNLTRFCPRDPATGLDAVTWWARHFATLWHTRIAAAEPHPDGLQFDGLDEWIHGDCDNDGVLDGCEIDGVGYWRLGLYDFFRKLRRGDGFRGLGDALILADASDARGPRCLSLLNGSENEEFPSFSGEAYFPAGLDLFRVWSRDAAAPSVAYAQSRYECDTYRERDWSEARRAGASHDDAFVRLSIAAACLGSGIHTYRTGGRRDRDAITDGTEVLGYPWDEYHAGREGRHNWLGLPMEEAVRLTDHLGPDLLPTTEAAGWKLDVRQEGIRATGPTPATVAGRPGVRVEVQAIEGKGREYPRAKDARAVLHSPETGKALDPSKEYTVEFDIQATVTGSAPEAWGVTLLWLECGGARGIEQAILAGPEPRRVALTLRASAGGRCRVAFLAGHELGSLAVGGLQVREGCAEVFARRFEYGLVLVNASSSPHTFDLTRLGGGKRYRRFAGAQAPDVNTGEPAGARVTLAPMDGLLLRREDAR